ncbi:MAG: acyl-CoA thioesterase [Chloroflexi bacterium]|nr:acyl-CoA thioesterase [Chloroflexota bacterium]
MLDEAMLESTLLHLVRPEDLNHHGTLFAGQMAKWLVEAGFITASRLSGKTEDVVCVKINGMTFKKPINNGDIIEIKSKIAHLGSTSMTVLSQVFRKQDEAHLVSNMATFVTVDRDNKPYKHGLKLPEEYIAKNRDIYQEALKIRSVK